MNAPVHFTRHDAIDWRPRVLSRKGRNLGYQADAHVATRWSWFTADRKAVSKWPERLRPYLIEACQRAGVSAAEVVGSRRHGRLMPARHEVAYRLKEEAGLTLPLIGRLMGGRHHTTSLNSVRKHAARLAQEAVR